MEDKKFYIDCDLGTEDTLSYQDSFKWYDMEAGKAYNYEINGYDYELDTTDGSIDGYEVLTTLGNLYGLTLRKCITTRVMLTVVLGAANGLLRMTDMNRS